MRKKIMAFSLMEIMVVIVLVGIVGAFGISKYNQGLRRSLERRAIGNLRLIRAAAVIYMENAGTNLPGMANLSAVNTTLGLGIVDNALTYSCGNTGGANSSYCEVNPAGIAWRYHFHQSAAHLPMKIHCDTASTCVLCPWPGDCG